MLWFFPSTSVVFVFLENRVGFGSRERWADLARADGGPEREHRDGDPRCARRVFEDGLPYQAVYHGDGAGYLGGGRTGMGGDGDGVGSMAFGGSVLWVLGYERMLWRWRLIREGS